MYVCMYVCVLLVVSCCCWRKSCVCNWISNCWKIVFSTRTPSALESWELCSRFVSTLSLPLILQEEEKKTKLILFPVFFLFLFFCLLVFLFFFLFFFCLFVFLLLFAFYLISIISFYFRLFFPLFVSLFFFPIICSEFYHPPPSSSPFFFHLVFVYLLWAKESLVETASK